MHTENDPARRVIRLSLPTAPITWQPIGGGLSVPTTASCRFTEDAVHLARFAAPTPADTVCDLGTGSGILPLLWCRARAPRSMAAVEREAAFVALLEEALTRFALRDRIRVYHTDWANDAAMPEAHSMTLVTCNPPYFRYGAARANADPLARAARHEDRPDLLETMCRAAARLLTEDGRLCLCHRPDRLHDITAALQQAGLTPRRLQYVQATPHAAPSLVLLEAGRHGTLQELPVHICHPVDAHTAVYKKLYR